MMQPEDDVKYRAAIAAIQEAAKQSSTIVPLLQAAYFAAISLSDIKKVFWGNWGWAIFFVVPALFWMTSMFLAIRVFDPTLVDPEASGAGTYNEIVQKKYRLLKVSQYTLLVGLLAMAFNVVVYFVYVPPPPSTTATTPTQFTPTLPTATNTPAPTFSPIPSTNTPIIPALTPSPVPLLPATTSLPMTSMPSPALTPMPKSPAIVMIPQQLPAEAIALANTDATDQFLCALRYYMSHN